jgi:selenocysteine lyase/cysteine desulfurase
MIYDVHALRAKVSWAARGVGLFDHASPRSDSGRARGYRLVGRAARSRFALTPDDFPGAKARVAAARLIGATPGTMRLANIARRNPPPTRCRTESGDVILLDARRVSGERLSVDVRARARVAEFRLLPLLFDWPDEGALMRAIETYSRVKVVSVSWVSFWSGHRFDIAAIGKACRARGIAFFVDAIQGLGPLALDVVAANVDVLACGAQKWLVSPWGVGFTYVREGLIGKLEPTEVGWWAQASSGDFARFLEYDPAWSDDARRFEVITLDFVGFNAMAESIGLLLELGPKAIEAHVKSLADRALAFADSTKGVAFVTPRDPARRAGVLAFRTKDVMASSERLVAAKVAHSVRTGCIRLAPHFYNTAEELDTALALLA